MSGEWHVCNPALMPDPLCPGCCEPQHDSDTAQDEEVPHA